LPGVEKAMVEMEGGGAEEIRERFARLGRRVRATCDGLKYVCVKLLMPALAGVGERRCRSAWSAEPHGKCSDWRQSTASHQRGAAQLRESSLRIYVLLHSHSSQVLPIGG
jgi:hypothetical protein